MEKPQSYQEKVRGELRIFLIKINLIQVYSINFFLSKDKAYIETYKKYSLGKKATENYEVSAALIYLYPCRIALCSVPSGNITVPSVQSLLHHKYFC